MAFQGLTAAANVYLVIVWRHGPRTTHLPDAVVQSTAERLTHAPPRVVQE